MTIGVYGNSYQDSHLPELRGFLAMLRESGHTLALDADFAAYLRGHGLEVSPFETVSEFPADASLAVSLGGDGTFLQAADWVGSLQTPIMGINTGHLGYLTGFSFSDKGAVEAIRKAVAGDYEISSRMTLRVASPFLPEGFSSVALNEISVSKGDTTSMVDIKAKVDGRYLADYLADGLVVATPTGSTAYNLSCGGPILEPTLNAFVLSPIAPHSLALRPLVIGSDSVLELEVSSRGAECHVGVDGRTFAVPASGSKILISKGDYRVNVVQPVGMDFPTVLRNKLGWGVGNNFEC